MSVKAMSIQVTLPLSYHKTLKINKEGKSDKHKVVTLRAHN